MYALSATPVEPSPAAKAAIAALKQVSCWSQEMHDCVETTKPSTVPNCALIRAGYGNPADAAAVDAAVEAVAFCPAPVASSPAWMTWVAAGAFGFVAGAVVESMLGK